MFTCEARQIAEGTKRFNTLHWGTAVAEVMSYKKFNTLRWGTAIAEVVSQKTQEYDSSTQEYDSGT